MHLDPMAGALTLTKVHATMNDFVVLLDPMGQISLTTAQVSWLCHRRQGVGADGFIRVIQTRYLDSATLEELDDECRQTQWFMDYRNSDGSLAQMCGNGVRAFVHYLREQNLVTLSSGITLVVGTRAGCKQVSFDGENYTVNMGPAQFLTNLDEATKGTDVQVQVPGVPGVRLGLRVNMPNPHTVVRLDDLVQLNAVRLPVVPVEQVHQDERPSYDPAPTDGTNLELVVIDSERRHITARILERGVGETFSCGTGCCASAVAAQLWCDLAEDNKNHDKAQVSLSPRSWVLDVRGGQLRVDFSGEDLLLSGPATVVATIFISADQIQWGGGLG